MLGAAAYLLYWHVTAGDAFAPVLDQVNWQREPAFPLRTIWVGTDAAWGRYLARYPVGYHLLDWLIVVPALFAGIWVAFRARPLYAVYSWASLLAPLSYPFIRRPFMSMPRLLLPVFPLLWAWAVWAARRRGVNEAIVAISGSLLGIMTMLFVSWYYVF